MNARLFFASILALCVGSGCRQILDIDEDRPLLGGGGAAGSGATVSTGQSAGSETSGSETSTTGSDTSTSGAQTSGTQTNSAATGGDLSEWPTWPLTPDGAPTANYDVAAETATDLTTGLTWVRQLPDESGDYAEAVAYCEMLDVGTFTDWRLPTRMELHTLLSYAGDTLTINEDVFLGELGFTYWTASRYLRQGAVDERWIVSFTPFVGTSHQLESETAHVVCVRRAP